MRARSGSTHSINGEPAYIKSNARPYGGLTPAARAIPQEYGYLIEERATR